MSDTNKEFIAQIALQLFAQKGYQGVGVQEICENAHITKPTLYHYFNSKRGLLDYLIQKNGEKLFDCIKDALVYERDFIKSITNVLKVEIKFAVENHEYFIIHSQLLNAPDESEEKKAFEELSGKIAKCYKEFFICSVNEFGNMKGKEELYSILFRNKVVSVSLLAARKELKIDEKILFQIIHSTVYGFAN